MAKPTRYRDSRKFMTPRDMAVIKHDEAVYNARLKRGEIEEKSVHKISVCGCGCIGCAIHTSVDVNPFWLKEKYPEFYKKKVLVV